MRGVLDDGVVADGPVKGGLVEAGLGDAQVSNHHLQRVAGLLLPVNRLYQSAQSINNFPPPPSELFAALLLQVWPP